MTPIELLLLVLAGWLLFGILCVLYLPWLPERGPHTRGQTALLAVWFIAAFPLIPLIFAYSLFTTR